MKIFRALKSNRLAQKFAVNKVYYGEKYGLYGHNGMDWMCYLGEPIYWDCDIRGTVIQTYNSVAGGVGCDVITEDKDGIFKHTFYHFKLDGLRIETGQVLESGDLIGYGDSTGISTGNHLHRQLKVQEKNEQGIYHTIDKDNGYNGAVDPALYLTNIFVRDYIATLLKQQISLIQQILAKLKKILALKIEIK